MPGQGGWSTSLNGSGTNGAVTSVDKPGYQFADRVRNDMILLGSLINVKPLDRGSRMTLYLPAAADTYEDHPDYVDVPVNWTALKGDVGDVWTVAAIVSLKCQDASTTVTPRIVIAGTTTLNIAGAAHASTSWGTQTLTLVSSTGTVTYRLQIKRSDLVYAVSVIAEMRIYV